MRPHPNDLHSSLFFEDLINETMLDIDSATGKANSIERISVKFKEKAEASEDEKRL